MSNPHNPYDPDPLSVAHAEGYGDGWDDGYAQAEGDRRWRVAGILLAAISGAVLGFLLATAIAHAAPRSAQPAIPAASGVLERGTSGNGASGNQAGPTGAPLGSRAAAGVRLSASASAESGEMPRGAPSPTDPPAIAGGLASWFDGGGPGLYAAAPSWSFGDHPRRPTRAGAPWPSRRSRGSAPSIAGSCRSRRRRSPRTAAWS